MKLIEFKPYFNDSRLQVIVDNSDTTIKYGTWQRSIGFRPGSRYCWSIDPNGEVQFGVWYDNPRQRPGCSDYWSSRPGELLRVTGVRAIEGIGNHNCVTNVTYEWLSQQAIPEGWRIGLINSSGEYYYGLIRTNANIPQVQNIVTLVNQFGLGVLDEVKGIDGKTIETMEQIKRAVEDILIESGRSSKMSSTR